MKRLFVCILLLATPVLAKWSVDLQRAPALSDVKKIAIVPMACADGVDCSQTEKTLVALVREHAHVDVIEPATLRQEAFNQGLTKPVAAEDLRRIAAALGADAVMIAEVTSLTTKSRSTGGFFVGSAFAATHEEKKNSGSSLLVTSLDGKPLLQATAYGESRNAFRTERGMVEKMFRLILEQAYPTK